MAAQHTPGPWSVKSLSDEVGFVVRAHDPEQPDQPWLIADCIADAGYGEDPIEANARLIAAAPDLLAIVQSFVAHYPVGLNPFLDRACNAGRAAIAKATEA